MLARKNMASRARNKLTARQVATIAKLGVHSDGGGLYLRIRPSGRSWFYIGSLDGKRFELGLGSAVDISLAKARELALKIRLQLIDGLDPMSERKKAQVERKRLKAEEEVGGKAQQAGAVTFGKFAAELLADIEDGFKNRKHRQQWHNTLKTHAEPLASIPIDQVSTEDIVAVLQPIWLSKPETASRVRGRIERVLDAAKAKGLRSGDNPARNRGHLELLLPKRGKVSVNHHPAIAFGEIAAFVSDLRKQTAVSAKALEFTILTVARSGETRGMIWAEINLDEKLWTVPASRMKAGSTHEVPLSDAAMAVLNAVKEDGLDPEDFVFAAPRGGSFSDMALSQLLKRMGRKGITVHGFRSTFRDWAGEKTQFGREEVEMALAHTLGSSVERAYRRGRALEKRRELMTAWADYCALLPTKA